MKKSLYKLFPITEEKNHIVIKFLGIKIKFKTNKHIIPKDKIISVLYETTIPVKELFLQQYRNGNFNIFDTIVRLLAIENYYNKNDYGWDLYTKMQDARIGSGYSINAVKRFKKLIESWEKKGYDSNSKIIVNKNMKLIDGSHRLAMAIYHNEKNICVKVQDTEKEPLYGLEWFVKNKFLSQEIDIITKRLETTIFAARE